MREKISDGLILGGAGSLIVAGFLCSPTVGFLVVGIALIAIGVSFAPKGGEMK